MSIKKTNFCLNSIKVLFYSFFILYVSNSVWSKNYFVSKQGSDENNGTINSPFKKITYGISKLKDGDTLFIREGKYYEFLNLKDKKFNKKTVLQNYQNETVEIINLTKLSNPKINNNRIEFNSEKPIIDIFINGENQIIASYPNRIENKLNYKKGATAIADSIGRININGSEIFDRSKSIICGLFSGKIISVADTIKSFSGNQNYLDSNLWFWKIKEYIDTGNVFLFNNLNYLDNPKEWFFEKNTLYFIPENNQNVENLILEARTENYVLDASNCSNLKFYGLNFFAGKINLQNSVNTELTNCTVRYATPFFTFKNGFEKFSPLPYKNPTPADTWSDEGPDWSNLNTPENWKGNGVEVSGENNTIENCYIAHTWGDGLTIWGKGHKIKNNIITDFNWIGNDCSGISIAGLNHEISFNDVSYGGRSLILHSYLMKSKITNNNLHHGGLICNDQGLTYAFWTDGKGTEIAYNYLHHNLGKKNHCGLYLDNWTYNFNIHHNIINNTGTGININKPHNNHTIYNNTLYNNTYSMGSWGPDGTEIKNVKTFNNLTNTNKKTKWNYDAFYGTELDSNYVYFEDNIFQDPQNHNFQLRKYSYPIDKGITSEFTKDYNGSLPDLGAIESGSIPWEYGSSLIVPNEKYYGPKAPIHLKIVTNTPEITLFSWEYPFEMVDSFYVERKISTEPSKIIQRLQANQLTFKDTILSPGEYRYQVRVKNQYGISEPSNSIEVFVPKYDNSLFLDAENNDLQFGNSIAGDIVINSDHSDWICYKEIDFGIGIYDACLLNMAVPCEQAWQEVQIRIDRPMGRMIGNLITTNTGGWDKFEYRTIPIEKTTGKHDVYIRFEGEQGIGTFDWFNLFDSKGTVKESLPNANKCPKPKNPSRIIAVTIFPNPSSEEVSVSVENIEESIISIRLISTQGKTLLTMIEKNQLPGTQEFYLHDKMNISNLEKGLYFVEVTITGKRVIQSKSYKFMKN